MGRRIVLAAAALVLPLAASLTLLRTRRVAREEALRVASLDARDALALTEGCLLGGGARPSRRVELEQRVRRLALGEHGGAPWPGRCAAHAEPLARIERGGGGSAALRSVSRAAMALQASLAAPAVVTELARFRAGEGDFTAPWLGPLEALRTSVETLLTTRGSLKTPSSQFAPRPLPPLALESLPVQLSPAATLVGTRSAAGVFVIVWQDGASRVACRSADRGISVRCRRDGDEAADPVSGESPVSPLLRGGVLRVRGTDGVLRALTDDRAHGGIEARAAWAVPLGSRVLLTVAGEGVSMFWSDDGGRRWNATREGL